MAAQRRPRQARPVTTIVAAVWLLAAVLFLFVAVRGRLGISRVPPMPTPRPLDVSVGPVSSQQVVVPLVDLPAGELIVPDLVELRPAAEVIAQFPGLAEPEAPASGDLLSGYYESLEDLDGQFAAVDLPADRPIALGAAAPQSPLAHPLDAIRTDRFTIEVPTGPTIHPLLVPGDRVDVLAVAGEESLGVIVRQARIVAVNQLAATGERLGAGAQELKGGRYEAARRKKARLDRQRRQQQQQEQGGEAAEEPPPESEAEPAQAGAAAEPEATREGSGRTLTLQVTPSEAQALALVHRITGVRLEFALYRRG